MNGIFNTWTDYDGVNTYSDFISDGSTITNGDGYELGIAHMKRLTPSHVDTFYAHNDHLGTLRAESDVWAAFNTYPVHTAFGEDMTGFGQRHSYAGAFGYQSNTNFTALHVGARYYDPASGRFLQRDPIGINGGINVYAYVGNAPTIAVDPYGNMRIPVKGRDVPSGSRGTLKWPGSFGPPTSPNVPWYLPNFKITTPVVLACIVAAGAGTAAGLTIDHFITKPIQEGNFNSNANKMGGAFDQSNPWGWVPKGSSWERQSNR